MTALLEAQVDPFSLVRCPPREPPKRNALVAACTMSLSGTFETCRLHRATSAFEGNPEDICSD